jgi:hypothetical protein
MDPMYTAHGVGYLTPGVFSFTRGFDREQLAALPGAMMTDSAVNFSHVASALPGLEAAQLVREDRGEPRATTKDA